MDVQITLPDPAEAKPKKVQVIADAAALLERAGHVSFRSVCPNLVVTDGAIVWYGGIASFAYPRPHDQVLRFVSREVTRELEGLMRKERTAEGRKTTTGPLMDIVRVCCLSYIILLMSLCCNILTI